MVVGMQLACLSSPKLGPFDRHQYGRSSKQRWARGWASLPSFTCCTAFIQAPFTTEAAGMTVGFVVIVAITSLVVSRLSGMSDLSDDGRIVSMNYMQ